mgnify:CR=1 FL=1
MIFDHLNNTSHYSLDSKWKTAFEFLREFTSEVEEGEYPIDGEKLFAKVLSYETRGPEGGNIESHQCYADIQICLDGAEGIDIYDTEKLAVRKPYDADTDLAFYHAKDACRIARVDLYPGSFVILWPRDAHRPQMAVGVPAKIKKAVVKVRLED